MLVHALGKDDLIFIANRYHEPYSTYRTLRCRDERSHVINLICYEAGQGLEPGLPHIRATLFPLDHVPWNQGCLCTGTLIGSCQPRCVDARVPGGGECLRRECVYVKVGVLASCLAFIITNVHFFLSLFFFLFFTGVMTDRLIYV